MVEKLKINKSDAVKALKAKVERLNEKWISTTQREEKALLYSQLEKTKRELDDLESKPEKLKTNLDKLKERQAKVEDLKEKYKSTIQREDKAILYSQLEKAQKELGKLEEKLDIESKVKSKNKEEIKGSPTNTPVEKTVLADNAKDSSIVGEVSHNNAENPVPTAEQTNLEDVMRPKKTEAEIEAIIDAELKSLSTEEKKDLGKGLATLGFRIEKKKDDYFANTFDLASKIMPKDKEGAKKTWSGAVGRFCAELRDSFVRDAKIAEDKAIEVVAEKNNKIENALTLTSNLVKYGRVLADATGLSVTLPRRYLMITAMAVGRGADAAKETRLKNEEVIEKTRIEDADKAAEEAWAIYESAQKKSGKENVSLEDLKQAYTRNMPKDLIKRIQEPVTGANFMQNVYRKQINWSLGRLVKAGEKIEANTKWTPEKKEAEKAKLLKKWEKDLKDYDRMVSQAGTVEAWAMAGKYLEKGSKAVVWGMTLDTIYQSLHRGFELMHGHAVSTNAPNENLTTKASAVSRFDSHQYISQPDHADLNSDASNDSLPQSTSTPHDFSNLLHENSQIHPDTTTISDNALNPDAIVHHGEGIENAFIRQIEHNQDLAKSLGWDGREDLHHFAGNAAHKLAINKGYVDPKTGQEIWVHDADKSAFEIKLEDGHATVVEKTSDGNILETHHEGDAFNQHPSENEYSHQSTQAASPMERGGGFGKVETPTDHPNVKIEAPHTPHVEELKEEIIKQIDANQVPTGEIDYTPLANTHDLNHINMQDVYRNMNPRAFLDTHPEIGKNYFKLPTDKLWQVSNVYQRDMGKIFTANTTSWNSLAKSAATDAFEKNSMKPMDKTTVDFFRYIRNLRDISGIKPNGGFLWLRGESAANYISRALQKIAEAGKLDQVKM